MPRETSALVMLDLRAPLRADDDPMTCVMRAAASLAPDGMLELVTPSDCADLVSGLRAAGYDACAARLPDGAWQLSAARPALLPIADYSELPPPEPLERVLEAASALAPGAVHLALLPRDPVHAKPHFDARGFRWQVAVRPDGRALLWLRR